MHISSKSVIAYLLLASSSSDAFQVPPSPLTTTTGTTQWGRVRTIAPHGRFGVILKSDSTSVEDEEAPTISATATMENETELKTESATSVILEHASALVSPITTDETPTDEPSTTTEDDSSTTIVIEDEKEVVTLTLEATSPTTTTDEPSTTITTIIEDEEKIETSSRTIPSDELEAELEQLAADFTQQIVGDFDDDDGTCIVNEETAEPMDEICTDEGTFERAKCNVKSLVSGTIGLLSFSSSSSTVKDDENEMFGIEDEADPPGGDLLEQGWERRGNSSSVRRNAEVWKFALRCVFKALKPKKMGKEGKSEEKIVEARTEAATYIRDGLLRLGPSFVKLGQVISTRTDVLPLEYTEVLKTLQDDVPGFSGQRAKDIVSAELGRPYNEVFQDFSDKPLAAASLGQVHTAFYKGKKVAVKVQRAGLKELFDVDLKNLKKLAALLDKFDPKTDGADRNWVSIYEESERLLYEEINYINEADNSERFSRDFKDTSWVRVPSVYRDITTPRVLTMEYVDSFKLTNIDRVEELGLDKELIAKRTADAFLRQIIETGYFHCDPHPGNMCVDTEGNLVFYDYGMMDELRPNVRSGFRKFCSALFAGGPTVSDATLAKNAKKLVDGVEEAGVLARGADRLAVEKFARYFMRTFKDKQLGKEKGPGLKSAVGTDIQTLTEANVFRFPSTFTFIFRSFASIDGIGKGLDPNYDIGQLAQPFIERFIDKSTYKNKNEKNLSILKKATGLNLPDINTAITSPRKIAYIEETVRAMEDGSLKIRVRSLENEKALERMNITQGRMEQVLLTSVFLNIAGVAGTPIVTGVGLAGAAYFGLQSFLANAKIKKFDKTQEKFVQTQFVDDEKVDTGAADN